MFKPVDVCPVSCYPTLSHSQLLSVACQAIEKGKLLSLVTSTKKKEGLS